MINNLPDEVILEIFDSYRQGIDSYDYQWRKKCVWFNLTHICRRWRAVIFASSSHLDLGISVGPEKPADIKTILSGPLRSLPILMDYRSTLGSIGSWTSLTDSTLCRLRAALGQCDRVREIFFEGACADFVEFFKATNSSFPVLESLALRFSYKTNPEFPATFLRGQNQPDLHLRRLKLYGVSTVAFISGFLSSATSLTDLFLLIDTALTRSPSAETSLLLTCLQGMPCLRSLGLSISSNPFYSSPQPSTLKDIAQLSKLTHFRYVGHSVFLNVLVAGLSAPSLLNVNIEFLDTIWSPIPHLPPFFQDIEYHAAHVNFLERGFRLSLLTQSEYVSHCKPRFELGLYPSRLAKSIIRMVCALPTKLATVEELRVTFVRAAAEDDIPWRRFYQQFPSVKALRIEGENSTNCIARTLRQDHEGPDDVLAFLPTLEEIELGKNPLLTDESQRGPELAAFQPFVCARQQAGRPVRVFFGPVVGPVVDE